MRKIVINKCWGGFGLSDTALKMYQELSNSNDSYWDIRRDDPLLVQVVEELKDQVNTVYSELKVVEIPDDIDWYIHDRDGVETINQVHQSWG
jgi:hypothetical protein